jgi:hypothetical protein
MKVLEYYTEFCPKREIKMRSAILNVFDVGTSNVWKDLQAVFSKLF